MTPQASAFWAISNSLWQSLSCCAAVALFVRIFPRTAAAVRYVLWAGVLVACAVLPAVDYVVPARAVSVAVPVQVITSRALGATAISVASPAHVIPMLAMAVWTLVAAALCLRLALGYAELRALKRGSRRERVAGAPSLTRRTVDIGTSPSVAQPCVIGFVRPLIALPEGLIERMAHDDLLRILRHECAHLERWDDYAKFVEQVLSAVLFFNPVARIAARALDVEREIACDDVAASLRGERIAFAKCLYELAAGTRPASWSPAAGFLKNRRHVSVRISRLLDARHNASTRLGWVARCAVPAFAAVIVLLAHLQITARPLGAPPPPRMLAPVALRLVSRPAIRARVSTTRVRLSEALKRSAAPSAPGFNEVATIADAGSADASRALRSLGLGPTRRHEHSYARRVREIAAHLLAHVAPFAQGPQALVGKVVVAWYSPPSALPSRRRRSRYGRPRPESVGDAQSSTARGDRTCCASPPH